MSKKLITPEDAQDELAELERDLDANSVDLNYDYKEINDKAQRLSEWVRNKIPDHLNEEAMKMRGAGNGQKMPPELSADKEVPSQIKQEAVNYYKNLESRKVVVETIAIGLINCAKKSINNLKALKGNLGEIIKVTIEGRLEDPQTRFREARKYLEAFRYAHNLYRPAKYESNTLKFFSILLIYLAIETFVNGFFYSKVTDGLIASWGIALTVAALIIALGAGAGEFGTRLRGLTEHRRRVGEVSADDLYKQGWYTADGKNWYKWEKHSLLHTLFWGGVTLGCVILGLVVVAFAYVYRDAAEYLLSIGYLDNLTLVTATEAIMVEAMARLSELALLPYSGLSAITLIVINGLMFVISFYKFHFQRDDCIPGYAQNYRNLKEAYYRYKKAINEMDPSLDLNDRERTIDKLLENRIIEMGTFIDGIRDGTDPCFVDFPEFDFINIDKFNEAHKELCDEYVYTHYIVRNIRDWKNDLITEHIIEIEKYEASRI